MKTQRVTGKWAFLGLVIILALMTGCEGSGSSGFDQNDPRFTQEQNVMIAVNNEGKCKTLEGVEFCSIQSVPEGNNGSVTVEPSFKDVSCVLVTPDPCELRVSVTSNSLSGRFVIAVRYTHPFSKDWEMTEGFKWMSNSDRFEAVVPFKLSAEKNAKVDLAVLSYQDPNLVLPSTGTIAKVLADFKPSTVYLALNVAVTATSTTP